MTSGTGTLLLNRFLSGLSVCAWALFLIPNSAIHSAELVRISKRGCVAATAGTGNKIITHQNKTHVAWLDSNKQGYFAVIKTLDLATRTWSPTYTLGRAKDDHGRPALTIDRDGYLHAVYGVHHDQIPYRRSKRPNDASEWEDIQIVDGQLTYPTLVCGPDNTLFLTGRDGWKGVRLYVKHPRTPWEDRGLIIRSDPDCISYAAFHEGLAWGPQQKTLHLACQFFQGKSENSLHWGTVQSVNYMRSDDFGRSWHRADKSPISLPATSNSMDTLASGESFDPKPGLRNTGAIVVDSGGIPHILYYQNTPQKPGQVFLAKATKSGQWQQLPLQSSLDRLFPGWAVVDCRAGFSITRDDRLCMALTLAPIDHPEARWDGKPLNKFFHEPAYWQNFFPMLKKIVWLESSDRGHTFQSRDVIKADPYLAHLQPSIEMPTGFNTIPTGSLPGLLYHTGQSRNPDGQIIDNDVFFVQPNLED